MMRTVAVLTLVLAGCGSLAAAVSPEILVPRGRAVTVDGIAGDREWDEATVSGDSGVEVELLATEEWLQIGIRSEPVFVASVCLQRGSEVHVFHASSALGHAVYSREAGSANWNLVQGFQWRLRSTESGPDLAAARGDHRETERWVANTQSMSSPARLVEFQISTDFLTEPETRIALGLLMRGDEPFMAGWPLEPEADGCVTRPVVAGPLPEQVAFRTSSWAAVRLDPERARPVAGEEGELAVINGTELFIRVLGQGRPIVVVHGGPGFDHSYFLPQLAELAGDAQLIFYDQRASGRSSVDLTPEDVTLEQFIADIEGIRQAFHLQQFTLMGHSFGGMLAMQYAIRHPERLSGLILLNSTAASSDYAGQVGQLLSARLSAEASERQAVLLQSEAMRNREPEAILEFLQILLSANFHDPARVEDLHLYVPPDQGARSELLQGLTVDLQAYDIHAQLSRISCPTLVIRGSGEVLPLEATERILAAIPGARLQVLDECGHFPFVECNQELQSALRDFLTQVPQRKEDRQP